MVKEQRPPGLARIESLGFAYEFQVFMISPGEEQGLSPLQPVSLLLQSRLDSQQLPVADIVVSLHTGQLP